MNILFNLFEKQGGKRQYGGGGGGGGGVENRKDFCCIKL